MKAPKLLYLLLVLIGTHYLSAQVGIGINNPEPSSILQVDKGNGNRGILLPNVNIADLKTQAPITTATIASSLLVYNTNTLTDKGFYYWDGTEWTRARDNQFGVRHSLSYDSNDTSTNYNVNNYVPVVIFQNYRWNDNPNIYEYVNNTTIRIKKTGRYSINTYLNFLIPVGDIGIQSAIRVNGTTIAGAVYICPDSQNNNTVTGVNMSESIQLNANDTVQIVAKRTSSTSEFIQQVRLRSGADSFFEIEFIK